MAYGLDDIRDIVYSKIAEYPDLLGDDDPDLLVSREAVRRWFPDNERDSEYVSLSSDIIRDDDKGEEFNTGFDLQYRIEPPMVICDFLSLTINHRGGGRGRRLVELVEGISIELESPELYLCSVTNESFWTHMKYKPFKSHFEKYVEVEYWRKSKPSN